MALQVSNLDDRKFDQLASEARALIPRHFPAWTDHNPSDPGITLLELFAFLFEAVIYHMNRVPERSLVNFAKLVGVERDAGESISDCLRRAQESLEPQIRTVTSSEIEMLAREASVGGESVARAALLLEEPVSVFEDPSEAFVSLLILPERQDIPDPLPSADLRQEVFLKLRKHGLITFRPQVFAPEYFDVHLAVFVVRDTTGPLSKAQVQDGVESALRTFLHPLRGGGDGNGWPFGRSVFRSELYEVIEGLPGVDHVRALLLNGRADATEVELFPLQRDLQPRSLVRLTGIEVTAQDP